MRVVARVVRERDEARGALEEFLARGAGKDAVDVAASSGEAKRSEKRGRNEQVEEGGGGGATPIEEDDGAAVGAPTTKKPRGLDNNNADDLTKIPQETLNTMTATWEILSKNRRSISKKSKERTDEQMAAINQMLGDKLNGDESKKVNVGKSNAKAGVLCLSKISTSCHLNNEILVEGRGGNDEYIVSGGHDKQAAVYNVSSGQIVATLCGAGGDVIAASGIIVTKDVMLVATGSLDGVVRLYSVPISGGVGDEDEESRGIYSVIDTELKKIKDYVAAGKAQGQDFTTRAKDFIMSEITPLTANLSGTELNHVHQYIDKTLAMYTGSRYENPMRD